MSPELELQGLCCQHYWLVMQCGSSDKVGVGYQGTVRSLAWQAGRPNPDAWSAVILIKLWFHHALTASTKSVQGEMLAVLPHV